MIDDPRHKGGLGLGDGIVDRNAGSFIQDFHAEDLGSRHGAVFVGGRKRDVEGQDLIRVPGGGQLGPAADSRCVHLIQLVDGGADVRAGIADDRAVEQSGRIEGIGILELWANFVLIGDEQSARLVEQIKQGVTVEVDPDQGTGNAAFVAGIGAGIGRTHFNG